MNDFVFIPKSVASILFEEALSWEQAESLTTLLTLPCFREPVESCSDFSRYIVNVSSVSERVDLDVDYNQFTFHCGSKEMPFIVDFKVSAGREKKISYWVHRICNPVNFKRRHCFDFNLLTFPPVIWKIPRHTLIRWRYSCRLPIHKSNFAAPISTKHYVPEEEVYPSPSLLFKRITDVFFAITKQVDESSVSYSFLCYFYYYIHDKVIKGLQKKEISPRFHAFLWKFWEVLSIEAKSEDYPPRKMFRIEGRLRAIVGSDFFTKHPFSKFSYQNITKEERLKI